MRFADIFGNFLANLVVSSGTILTDYALAVTNYIVDYSGIFCMIIYKSISSLGDVMLKTIYTIYPVIVAPFTIFYTIVSTIMESLRDVLVNSVSAIILQLQVQNFLVGFGLIVIFIILSILVVDYDINFTMCKQMFNKVTGYVLFLLTGRRTTHAQPEAHAVNHNNRYIPTDQNNDTDRRDQARNTDSADKSKDITCVVCQDNLKSILLLPCKHLCICPDCVAIILGLRFDKRSCPLCRERIENIMDVYI